MARSFQLAGLLRLRQIEQEHAASDLAAANARVHDAAARQARARAALREVPTEVTDAVSMFAVAAARASSRSMLADLTVLAAQRDSEASSAQAAYTAAKTRAVGLEKLEARHVADEVAEDLHREQTAIDEIATTSWRRATADGGEA